MGRHFAVLGDNPDRSVFVKLVTQSPEMEYEKARAIYNLSLETDLFIAAEPLSFCGTCNLLMLRELPPFRTFGYMLGKYNRRLGNNEEILFELFHKAGKVLAELHASIHLATPHETVLPDIYRDASLSNDPLLDLISKGPTAHLHWDYGFSNLLVVDSKNKSPELCVIDASPQIIHGASIADKGSVYIDIGMFLSQVYFCIIPPYCYPMYKWEHDFTLSKVFLEGYECRAGIKLSNYAAFSTALLISRLYSRLFFVNSDVKTVVKRVVIQRGLRRLSSVCEQLANQ